MPFRYRSRRKSNKKTSKPTWDYRLSTLPPKTPQELAIAVINNNPEAFSSIKALVAAMSVLNKEYYLGFLATGIKEAAQFTVRADDPKLSAVYREIEYRNDLDVDVALITSAWEAFGSRFDDPDHGIDVTRNWMGAVKRRITEDRLEAPPMPILVGDARSRDLVLKPLLAPLRGFYGTIDAPSLDLLSIVRPDGIGTIPVMVVEIEPGCSRLGELACVSTAAMITMPGKRNVIRARNSTSFIGSSSVEVPGFANLLLNEVTTQLRIDHQLLWQSVSVE